MRKIVMMLLVLAMTVCGAVGIAACGKELEPEQNQGQVEQNKDKEEIKDKEEEKTPDQNKDDEEKEKEEQPHQPSENDPPETPEPQKPNPENPPKDDEQKEGDKKEEDKKDEGKEEDKDDGKEEEPPQSDEPGTGDSDEGKTDPTPDNPTKPEEKPEEKEPETKPETKPSEPEEKPACEHKWNFTSFYAMDFSSRHVMACSLCGATKSEPCTFDRNAGKKVDPTCTEDGYTEYTCQVCNNSFKTYGYNPQTNGHKYPATGHNFTGSWTPIEGTNQHEQKCSRCEEIKKEDCVLETETVAATCENGGSETKTCNLCNRQEETKTDALGHDMTNWNPSESGRHERHCQRPNCEKSETGECEFEVTIGGGSCTEDKVKTSVCKECHCKKIEKLKDTKVHTFTTSNICDKCGYDGLNYTSMRFGSFGSGNTVKFTEETKNATIIYITDKKNTPTGIAPGAFKGYEKLTKIYIPESIYAISKEAFEQGHNVEICYEGTQDKWEKIVTETKGEKFSAPEGFTVKYSEGIPEEYKKSSQKIAALPAEVGKRVYA